METEGKNLAHFMELPDRDIFAKTKPFLEFMDALAAREQHHWHRILSSPSEATSASSTAIPAGNAR